MKLKQRKKLSASPAYLVILHKDRELLDEKFEVAKTELYKHTATAKIGEGPFEQARMACVMIQKEIAQLEKEIMRVERENKRVSEM